MNMCVYAYIVCNNSNSISNSNACTASDMIFWFDSTCARNV